MKILLADAEKAKKRIPATIASLPKDALASPFRAEALSYLSEFATRGKTLRAALVCLGARLNGRSPDAKILRAACAIEVLHSSLLIQDDVMDKDAMRRGNPALHAVYGKKYKNAHTGESLAMCAADIGFFAGLSLLNSLGDAKTVELACRELAAVGAGQMEDVACEGVGEAISREKIISMYEQKTGRYSIYWPLATGWMLSGGSASKLNSLLRFSLPAGVLFQVTDDIVGLLSSAGQSGKPQGSDIAANKKTIIRERLFARAGAQEKKELRAFFGSPVSKDSLARICDTYAFCGAQKDVEDLCAQLENDARKALRALPGSAQLKSELESFLSFIHTRNK